MRYNAIDRRYLLVIALVAGPPVQASIPIAGPPYVVMVQVIGQVQSDEKPVTERPWLRVKVLAVQLMDDDGKRPCAIATGEVRSMVSLANQIYAPARIRFDYSGTRADSITLRNTVINSLIPDDLRVRPEDRAPGAAATLAEASQAADDFAKKNADRMVVFFRYGDSLRSPTGNGFSSGRAWYVAMPGLKATNMGLAGFSHEVGHYLGLDHTFGPSFKTIEEAARFLSQHQNNLKVFDGDGLSDTPPDPGLPIPLEDRTTLQVRLNGLDVKLPRGNVMSYYTPVGQRLRWLSPMQQERARHFHQIRFNKNLPTEPIELENLRVTDAGGMFTIVQDMAPWDSRKWSGGRQLFCRATAKGARLMLELPVAKAGRYRLVLYATRAPDYGVIATRLNDELLFTDFDGHALGVMASGPIELGERMIPAGTHRLRFEVTGKNASSTSFFFGLDAIELLEKGGGKTTEPGGS